MHTSETTITLVPKPDRREQLLQQIREEWFRSPQLRLSPREIQNRWDIEPSTCFDLLTVLMDQHVIARGEDGMVLRVALKTGLSVSRLRIPA